MRVLLDTHVLLFSVSEPKRLSGVAVRVLEEVQNELLVSSVSVFEIAMKHRLRRLRIPSDFVARLGNSIEALGAVALPVNHEHALRAGQLRSEHRDPFDRILAAQAEIEGVPLLTGDPQMRSLGVECIW